MLIDEKEVKRRLETEENLLNRLLRSTESPAPAEIVVPPEIPNLDDILNISDPLTTMEKPSKVSDISEAKLNKLLNPDPGYAGRGTKNLHRDTQAGIGITASILGTTRASRMNDVAISQSHSYERGYTGPVDLVNAAKTPKEDLQERIIAGHGIIVDKCFNRLLKSLDLLDDDKLERVQKASELSIVAKNLSGIIAHASHATQDTVEVQEKSVHFHIMKPEQAKDADYPTIEISSEASELAWQEKNRSS